MYIQNTDIVTCHGTLPSIADHSGIFLSLDIKRETQKPRSKTVYDYKNADVEGLNNYIKSYNFDHVFQATPQEQTPIYSEVLIEAFQKFIPSKTINIRHNIPPWSNTFTRLLLKKKNRNYHLSRKAANLYEMKKQSNSTSKEVLTRLRKKKEN